MPHRLVVGDVELDQLHVDATIGCHCAELGGPVAVPHGSDYRGLAAKWMAVARPMPEFAPVTTATEALSSGNGLFPGR